MAAPNSDLFQLYSNYLKSQKMGESGDSPRHWELDPTEVHYRHLKKDTYPDPSELEMSQSFNPVNDDAQSRNAKSFLSNALSVNSFYQGY